MQATPISIEKNDAYVVDSYSWGCTKSGIGILSIDIYTNNETQQYKEYPVLFTGFRPINFSAINVITNTEKEISFVLESNGTLKMNTNMASGKFNARAQMIII